MKTLTHKLTILFLLHSLMIGALYAQESKQKKIEQYNNLFEQIGERRVGLSSNAINKVKNPFLMEKEQLVQVADANNTSKTVAKPEYVLNGTLNNKAKINNSWYSLNSQVGEYKLVKIESNRVVLQNKHIKKELYIRKPNAVKIQFSSK